MQDSKFNNIKAMFQYTEWNSEMRSLYNKYSLVEELNHDLMRECPVYAMYSISEYLKRKRLEVEEQVRQISAVIYGAAGKDPIKFGLAHKEVEKKSYELLKPVVTDYLTARQYFIVAMFKTRAEYVDYLNSRELVPETRRAK